jgi:hypothetical protein
MHDFKNIFDKTLETVYKDNCCHLNKYGNTILIKNLVEVIVNLK